MRRSCVVVCALVMLLALVATPAAAALTGPLTWAVHVSLATWFDPAETPGIITPYMDGRTYDFVLHQKKPYEDLRIKP